MIENWNEDSDGIVDDIMVIAVAADTETWLPHLVLGIPVDEEEELVGGIVPITMTPEEAYQVGAYLIQAAATVSSFYNELIDKSIEERKEIISLESHFLDSSYPF
jgi:hypothetical protein